MKQTTQTKKKKYILEIAFVILGLTLGTFLGSVIYNKKQYNIISLSPFFCKPYSWDKFVIDTPVTGSLIGATNLSGEVNKQARIQVTPTYLTLKVGEKRTLIAKTPENKKPFWTSSDESVATVTQTGTVTIHSLGQTVITVKLAGCVSGHCYIYTETSAGKIYVDMSNQAKSPAYSFDNRIANVKLPYATNTKKPPILKAAVLGTVPHVDVQSSITEQYKNYPLVSFPNTGKIATSGTLVNTTNHSMDGVSTLLRNTVLEYNTVSQDLSEVFDGFGFRIISGDMSLNTAKGYLVNHIIGSNISKNTFIITDVELNSVPYIRPYTVNADCTINNQTLKQQEDSINSMFKNGLMTPNYAAQKGTQVYYFAEAYFDTQGTMAHNLTATNFKAYRVSFILKPIA